MSSDNDGGQAFPHGDETHGGCNGMTLRDYFAAKAMPVADSQIEELSIAVAAAMIGTTAAKYDYLVDYPKLLAQRSYFIADAMLAERAKGHIDPEQEAVEAAQ